VCLTLLVAGCARSQLPAWPFGRTAQPPAAAAPQAPSSDDPVIAYVATARPGDQAQVTLPNGASASVRVVRAYNAASGRECRETLVGTGNAEQVRLICGGDAGWADARPLLRGSNTVR
jgi:uncharacterized protein (DUF3084 family)